MEQTLQSIRGSVDALTRKLSKFMAEQSQVTTLKKETLTKLNRILDDWDR